MDLDTALFNWLQIKVVYEARQEDNAAKETYEFFSEIIKEDHGVEIEKINEDETMYQIYFLVDGEKKAKRFDRELVDSLLVAIQSEPKYNQ